MILPKNIQLAIAVPIAGCAVEMLKLTLEQVEMIRLRISITLHKPLHRWMHLLMLLHTPFPHHLWHLRFPSLMWLLILIAPPKCSSEREKGTILSALFFTKQSDGNKSKNKP